MAVLQTLRLLSCFATTTKPRQRGFSLELVGLIFDTSDSCDLEITDLTPENRLVSTTVTTRADVSNGPDHHTVTIFDPATQQPAKMTFR